MNLAADVDDTESGRIGDLIAEHAPRIEGLEVLAGGQYLASVEPPETELIGIAFAVVVLILAFGSVLAMGLPIAVALGGVGTGIGSIVLLSRVVTMPEDTMLLGMMIGLGVGIDYALFVVTRYREGVHAGLAPRDATVVAMGTAGRAVVFAGTTVVISMLGLLLVGLGWLVGHGRRGVGHGAGHDADVDDACCPPCSASPTAASRSPAGGASSPPAFTAVALLGVGIGSGPLAGAGAVLAVAHPRGQRRRGAVAPAGAAPAVRDPSKRRWAHRWSRTIQRRPWAWLGAATVVLLALAAPALGMRLGWADEGNFPEATDTHQAYDLLADGFGDGFNGPFVITASAGSGGSTGRRPGRRRRAAGAPGRHPGRRRRDPARPRRSGRTRRVPHDAHPRPPPRRTRRPPISSGRCGTTSSPPPSPGPGSTSTSPAARPPTSTSPTTSVTGCPCSSPPSSACRSSC